MCVDILIRVFHAKLWLSGVEIDTRQMRNSWHNSNETKRLFVSRHWPPFFLKQGPTVVHRSPYRHTHTDIEAHRSLICHPNTARQTHSRPSESARRASNRSRRRKVGSRRACKDEDGWLHNSSECRHPADAWNFNPNLKRICCGLISFTGSLIFHIACERRWFRGIIDTTWILRGENMGQSIWYGEKYSRKP